MNSTKNLTAKIKYSLVFNHNNTLNKDGKGDISICLRQLGKRLYISTGHYVYPTQWNNTLKIVIDANNQKWADKITALLYQQIQEIESIECDFIHNGVHKTIHALKEAYKQHFVPSTNLFDFIDSVLSFSSNKNSTKENYKTLKNSLKKYKKIIFVEDVDYAFVQSYYKFLLKSNITTATIATRMAQLRMILNEAIKHKIITDNPIEYIKIETSSINKKEYIHADELQIIEQLQLKKT